MNRLPLKGWLLALLILGSLPAQGFADKLIAVCSTTQVADFTRQVVGDAWDVRCILAPGQDPHLYEIKPGDARMVSDADLCVENGWHLEGGEWMRKLASESGKPLVTCVTGCKPLLIEESGDEVHDPHAWFDPRNAAVYVRNITAAVSKVDPDRRAEYEARAELYLGELRNLHQWTVKQLTPIEDRLLVTSHDAFGYFCRAYDFDAEAPAGWSTGAEIGAGVTPQRRRAVVNSIKEFRAKAIFVETSVNPKLIRQIAAEAGVKVGGTLYSDSMGAAGSAGETYVGMMRENVLKLVAALK